MASRLEPPGERNPVHIVVVWTDLKRNTLRWGLVRTDLMRNALMSRVVQTPASAMRGGVQLVQAAA